MFAIFGCDRQCAGQQKSGGSASPDRGPTLPHRDSCHDPVGRYAARRATGQIRQFQGPTTRYLLPPPE